MNDEVESWFIQVYSEINVFKINSLQNTASQFDLLQFLDLEVTCAFRDEHIREEDLEIRSTIDVNADENKNVLSWFALHSQYVKQKVNSLI